MNQEHAIYIPTPVLSQLSFHDYAQSCELYSIFAEITRVILRKNGVLSSQATQEYLQQCSKGQHVLLKSYGSFHKSALNRLCFLSNFTKIFQLDTHSRNGLDYFQLLRLLCSDFPKEIMTHSVNLLHPNIQNNMTMLLDSKKIVNALYVYFIYWDFCEALLAKFYQNQTQKISKSIYDLYEWIKNYNSKFSKIYQKPPYSILIQVILNIMQDRKMLGKYGKIVFLTQYNLEGYLSEKIKLQQQQPQNHKINFVSFMSALLENSEHIKLVQQNMAMFDIPQTWATEASKLLTIKDPNEHHPINSKRVKKK